LPPIGPKIDHAHDEETLTHAGEAAACAAARPGLTIAVTNEVGLGVHPYTALGREFRDLLGGVNLAWAGVADRVYLVVAGRALALEEAPSVALEAAPPAVSEERA
jgi:adenosyl cobinamide kinase/adenosyl cobinamide phosphate guanylyltransferase